MEEDIKEEEEVVEKEVVIIRSIMIMKVEDMEEEGEKNRMNLHMSISTTTVSVPSTQKYKSQWRQKYPQQFLRSRGRRTLIRRSSMGK